MNLLVSKPVKSHKTEKAGPPINPATAPLQKFLSLLRYNFFMGVNEMRVKNIGSGYRHDRVSLLWDAIDS